MYHVASRGDQREDIFLDVDRHDLIKTLAEACQKTDWHIHAFCLMRSHYYVVPETPDANLVSGVASPPEDIPWRRGRRPPQAVAGYACSGHEGRNAPAAMGLNREPEAARQPTPT